MSNNEQMSITIRWVDEEYNIFEEPIGLVQVPRADAKTLTPTLKDVFLHCMLPLNLCRGRHMTALLLCLVTFVEWLLKLHLWSQLHSMSIVCLNLFNQDASRSCTIVRDSLELVMEVVIKYSPKHSSAFQRLKLQKAPNTTDLRPLSNPMDSSYCSH